MSFEMMTWLSSLILLWANDNYLNCPNLLSSYSWWSCFNRSNCCFSQSVCISSCSFYFCFLEIASEIVVCWDLSEVSWVWYELIYDWSLFICYNFESVSLSGFSSALFPLFKSECLFYSTLVYWVNLLE